MKSNQSGAAPVLILVAVVGLVAFLAISTSAPIKNTLLTSIFPKEESQAAFVAPTPMPGCPGGTTTPQGQANPSAEYEPMGSIWCFPLSQMPTTRVTGANDWVDTFDTNIQMGKLGAVANPTSTSNPQLHTSRDMDYVLYNNIESGRGSTTDRKTQWWINANHWMGDMEKGFTGGQALRPDRSFKFENGKIVIEADVAVGLPDYLNDNDTFVEIDITAAPNPTNTVRTNLYGYGQFGGYTTFGCRLQADRGFICSHMQATGSAPAGSASNCNPNPGDGRVFEIASFLQCGSTHFGGHIGDSQVPKVYRGCQNNQMDIFCRDRIRIELSKTGVVIFVNGQRFFEDSNWPAIRQLPDSFVNGDVYVYFWNWTTRPSSGTTRFHWDRIAINPHDVGNHIQPPTQAPSFCLGQPQNTCPIIPTEDPQKPTVSKNNVEILDFVMSPPDVTIKAGDTVTWTNKSTTGQSHSVNAQDESWKSAIFGPNQTYSKKFDTPGVYEYYCLPHPNMVGKITVLADDGTAPSSTPAPSVAPSVTPSPSPSPSFVPGAVYSTGMDGIKNVPQINTNGTGTATLTLSQDEKSGKLDLVYNNLTSSAISAHIHGPADTSTNAAIIFPLTIGTPGQTVTTMINNITAQQLADLKNGLWYVNVHSTNFVSGEIRGQLALQGSSSPAPSSSSKPGDIDGNGKVDIFDFNTVLTNFGSTGTNIPGDLDKNGKVDIFDYNTVLSNFGK